MNIKWDTTIKAQELWHPVKAESARNSINIFEQIGEGFYGDGVTAKGISRALDAANGEDVTININSAGGDMFEGLAIYNIMREYEGKITVKVVGMAASAASVIAMAGDSILIAESAFFMIHNAWSVVMGNSKELVKIADDFSKFDAAMAYIYAQKTGKSTDEIAKMMDEETWLSGKDAVEMAFASGTLEENPEKDTEKTGAKALRKADVALAKGGLTRSERRDLLKELTNTPSAVESTQSASEKELVGELKALLEKLNTR